MEFGAHTINRYLLTLSSKEPVPGGGGACALVAALGVALGNMVGSLTVGKKKYAGVEAEMQGWMEQAALLRDELVAAMDQDAAAFLPLAAAYRLPSDTDAQKAHRAEVMETALQAAADAPLSLMRSCCRGLELIEKFAAYGSALALSDAGVAAAFCRSALQGAAMNVWINTKLMQDRAHADRINAETASLLDDYTKVADEILQQVTNRLKP